MAVVRYDDLLLPVADAHPEGFCTLIVEARQRCVLGTHVLGEHAVEVIQHGGGIHGPRNAVVRVAELHLAYPIFTEAVGLGMVPLMATAGASAPLYI